MALGLDLCRNEANTKPVEGFPGNYRMPFFPPTVSEWDGVASDVILSLSHLFISERTFFFFSGDFSTVHLQRLPQRSTNHFIVHKSA